MKSRREFIVGACLSSWLLAGCITDGSSDDIVIYNDTGRTLTVTILITNIDTDEKMIEETFTLQHEETDDKNERTYSEVSNGEKTVNIHLSVDGGPEGEHEFKDTNADSSGVAIYIEDGDINFIEGDA